MDARGHDTTTTARRRLLGAATAAALLLTAACGADDDPPAATGGTPAAGRVATTAPAPSPPATPSGQATGGAATGGPAPTAATTKALELPRGGRTILPTYRLVGFAGRPRAEALGRLGIGSLATKGREIEAQARPYAAGRTVLPVFELIATLSHRTGGKDGMYRSRADDDLVASHLAAARKAKGLLLINIQPGRSDFLTEVRAYEKWLRQPDVGVALDPEWAMRMTGGVPGKSYGRTTGAELDGVAAYLAAIVARHALPEKVMVFHQVALSIVRDETRLRAHKGVFIVKSVDGIGSATMKRDTWRALTRTLAPHVKPGFKLFYTEDTEGAWRLMTPREVLALRPTPDYVMYE